jgi:Cutinase
VSTPDRDYACGSNRVLLYHLQGSGESPGKKDNLKAWENAARAAAERQGWAVDTASPSSDDYQPPNLPIGRLIEEGVIGVKFGGIAGGAAAVFHVLKPYRDAATHAWPGVKGQLESAYRACPQRKIVLAAYSMGAIVIRYLDKHLDRSVWNQVVHVDLVGDPTADRRVDGSLGHPAALGGRITDGMDTWSGRLVHLLRFKQTPYPADRAARVSQFCLAHDYVCDFTVPNIIRAIAGKSQHRSYSFSSIGTAAGRTLGSR